MGTDLLDDNITLFYLHISPDCAMIIEAPLKVLEFANDADVCKDFRG